MADKDLQNLVRRRLWELARSPDEASRVSRWVIPPEIIQRMARTGGKSFITEGLARLRARAGADPRDSPVGDDDRSVADKAEGPLTRRRVVGDEFADAVDQERHHSSIIGIRTPRSRATSRACS